MQPAWPIAEVNAETLVSIKFFRERLEKANKCLGMCVYVANGEMLVFSCPSSSVPRCLADLPYWVIVFQTCLLYLPTQIIHNKQELNFPEKKTNKLLFEITSLYSETG